MKSHYKHDKKTLALIKGLLILKKNNPKNFTPTDEKYLSLLINKKIDNRQIDEEKELCKNNPIHFINKYIYVKHKFPSIDDVPEHLKSKVDGNKIKLELYDIQTELVNNILDYNKIISVKSRQIGFTTTSLALSLHLLTFSDNKVILLFSKSEKDAKTTLGELKFMRDNLPFFLRRKEYVNNEKELSLGNNLNRSQIIVQTSGKSSGRSHAATQIILDEADYIMGVENIYRAAAPATSSSGGKIIVLSTPNIHGSQFHNMVKGAEENKNGFKLIKGAWQSIPQRTKEWYEEQCSLLNYDKKSIMTELDMGQILPYDTYFDDKKLLKIKNMAEENIICGIVTQYYKPSNDHTYLISVDCQEEGSHYNAIIVFDIDTRKIMAAVKTRMNIYDTLIELSSKYNNAKIMIERNRGFYLIKKFEENDLSEMLLPNIKYIAKTDKFEFDIDDRGNANKLGFVNTKHTRNKLLIHVSDYIHKATELPKELLDEAKTFVIKRGRPEGLDSDDLIMSFGICLLTLWVIIDAKNNSHSNKKLKYLIENYQGNTLNKKSKKQLQKEKIDEQIGNFNKSLLLSTNLLDNYSSMLELEQIQKSNSKIKKIFSMFI